jgi:hypothetical protein
MITHYAGQSKLTCYLNPLCNMKQAKEQASDECHVVYTLHNSLSTNESRKHVNKGKVILN